MVTHLLAPGSSDPVEVNLPGPPPAEQPAGIGALPRYGNWCGFTPETVEGQDLLGFGEEAESLALMLTDPRLCPPLTLGVFGEWGSGKSFFIRMLLDRIRKISQENQASGPRVVQLSFNAWQYAQANIWSAL